MTIRRRDPYKGAVPPLSSATARRAVLDRATLVAVLVLLATVTLWRAVGLVRAPGELTAHGELRWHERRTPALRADEVLRRLAPQLATREPVTLVLPPRVTNLPWWTVQANYQLATQRIVDVIARGKGNTMGAGVPESGAATLAFINWRGEIRLSRPGEARPIRREPGEAGPIRQAPGGAGSIRHASGGAGSIRQTPGSADPAQQAQGDLRGTEPGATSGRLQP